MDQLISDDAQVYGWEYQDLIVSNLSGISLIEGSHF